MMTINQFRDQCVQTDDLHAHLPADLAQYYEDENGAPIKTAGYIYPGHGVIEALDGGVYALTLGNEQHTAPNVAPLEARLYEWLADDGALS